MRRRAHYHVSRQPEAVPGAGTTLGDDLTAGTGATTRTVAGVFLTRRREPARVRRSDRESNAPAAESGTGPRAGRSPPDTLGSAGATGVAQPDHAFPQDQHTTSKCPASSITKCTCVPQSMCSSMAPPPRMKRAPGAMSQGGAPAEGASIVLAHKRRRPPSQDSGHPRLLSHAAPRPGGPVGPSAIDADLRVADVLLTPKGGVVGVERTALIAHRSSPWGRAGGFDDTGVMSALLGFWPTVGQATPCASGSSGGRTRVTVGRCGVHETSFVRHYSGNWSPGIYPNPPRRQRSRAVRLALRERR